MTVDQVLLPDADFMASQVEITEGDMIDFTDMTANNPTSWLWNFDGGEPATSTEQNPASILYATPGTYDVILTASNNGGNNTELKADYITVNAGMAPESDFYADVTEIVAGDSVNFFDLSTGNPTQWTWTFEGADPGGSAVQNPTNIVYPTDGTYYVRLRTKNSFGNHTTQKENYIVVGNISVKDLSRNDGMVVYPNPSRGEVRIRLTDGNEKWGNGGLVEVSVINSTGHMIRAFDHDLANRDLSLNLGNEPDGLYIIRFKSDNHLVQKKISLLK
jgi:PKD repeat protein